MLRKKQWYLYHGSNFFCLRSLKSVPTYILENCGLKPLAHKKSYEQKSTQMLRFWACCLWTETDFDFLSTEWDVSEQIRTDLWADAIEQKQNSAQTGELRHLSVWAFAQKHQKKNYERLSTRSDSKRAGIGPREDHCNWKLTNAAPATLMWVY